MLVHLRLFSDRLDRAVMLLCGVLIAVMFSISLFGIAWQTFTGHALIWGTSLARLLLPWIAMLSVTVAFKRGEHIAMGMFVSRLPGAMRHLTVLVGLALVAGFALALVWYGYGFFVDSTELIMVSDKLQVSAKWVAASVPVSGLVLLLHLVQGRVLLGAAS
ncbi:MAG: TRAP transporter small permease subunit [Alphaproteobacteria bacterium]|nr:TRAP transporter small permease subunit [Alphaproteobacteria bacterium]